jgi:hypothetical protein
MSHVRNTKLDDSSLPVLIHSLITGHDGFGGLVVSLLATGSNPAEAVGFFGHPKNPQYALLWRGSKIICPMSQLWGM